MIGLRGGDDRRCGLSGTDYPYSDGERTLQVDVLLFYKNKGTLSAYEIKRGAGLYDSGKRPVDDEGHALHSGAVKIIWQATRE